MEYLEFELKLGEARDGAYPVDVLRSPAGEQRGVMRLAGSADELRILQESLEASLRSTRTAARDLGRDDDQQLGNYDAASVQRYGRMLFESALCGDVATCFRTSRALARAAQPPKGLRIRLRTDDPALAQLPWELMYDATEGEYLTLSAETPLVRHLELGRAVPPLAMRRPLRILGMVARPADLATLHVDPERERMQQALDPLLRSGDIHLQWIAGENSRSLRQALQPGAGPWHVFHFIGHGGFSSAEGEGVLMLRGENARAEELPASHLGRILGDHPSLRLTVLNACEGARGSAANVFSSTAATLMRRGLPAVIAMQNPISDPGAIEFSREFYTALARGLPVDTAVAEGRKAVSLASARGFEWVTPVLHMRAADGQLFDLSPDPAEQQAAAFPELPGTSKKSRLVFALLLGSLLLAYVIYALI
ncbi:MAG: CHAT domain-containing protein [Gemmatimonadota bacterium]